MSYTVGIDTGGTFTDCVAIREDGEVFYDKALTSPQELSRGVIQSLANGAEGLGLSAEGLLRDTRVLGHGTTVATNRLFTRTGVKVGLITTAGHEDAILIGRIYQKVAGLVESEITNAVRLDKPEPIVPRPLIKGVTERVDYKGQVIVTLNRDEAREAIESLVGEGVEAIAVCFLWSFMNPRHEQEVKGMIEEMYPHLFVTISSELAPIMGEYERTATCVLNSYLGSTVRDYLLTLDKELTQKGLKYPYLVMQSMGGVVPAQEASQGAIYLLSSGPAGGVIGSLVLSRLLGIKNVITTDVGGTSFDVGIIAGGEVHLAREPVFEQYHVLIPVIDITSIGAGGGSIARVDPKTRLLRVGPESAGAYPGPVCYDLGGTEPTVSDADVVLGRINPDYFFGGRMKINRERAWAAIREKVADPLGMDVVQAAKGIVDIVDAHMADLVRKVSIERGYDPRDFVLFAYGGGGPTHVGAYAMDVGVKSALVSPYAPVFSAFGIAGSDIVRAYAKSDPIIAPAALQRLNQIYEELEERAQKDLRKSGRADGAVMARFVEMRFRRQTNQVRVPVPTKELTAEDVDAVIQRFEGMYEQVFGQGTAYKRAGVEMSTFGVTSTISTPKPSIRKHQPGPEDPSPALKGEREVFFGDRFVPTKLYSAESLRAGFRIQGPAIVEGAATTVVVHPNQKVEVDEYLNMIIKFD